MKISFFVFTFILFTTKVFCCDINLKINKDKIYYSEIIKSTKNPIFIELTSNEINIKSVCIIDNSGLFKIKNLKNGKVKNKKFKFIISKKEDKIRKRIKIEIKDFNGKSYFLTLLIYSKKYNIDNISAKLSLEYDKTKDYPIALISNSHVVGNYYIFDKFGKQIYYFEILRSFSIIVNALKKGKYFICENNFSNKLFVLTIK